MPRITLSEVIRNASIRFGARGFTSADMNGYDTTQVNNVCRALHRKGQLFQAKLGHRSVRWFAHAVDRDAFLQKIEGKVFDARPDRKGLTLEEGRAAGRDAFTHVFNQPLKKGTAQWPEDAPIIIPPHVKVQQCPGYEPPFQALAAITGRCYGSLARGRVQHDPGAEELERVGRTHA